MSRTSQDVQLRCVKCLREGTRPGRRFDTVWMWHDELYGFAIETDLADQIEAVAAGKAYESPAWRGSTPYINRCRCGNQPKLKLETLANLVREALRSGETIVYI